MSGRLLELLEAIRDQIPARLEDASGLEINGCTLVGGRLTLADLQRIGHQAPTALLAVLRKYKLRNPGYQDAQLVVYLVCRNRDGRTAHEWGIELSDALTDLLPGSKWGVEYASRVLEANVEGVNWYNGDVNDQQLSLWAVTWLQTYRKEEAPCA